MCVVRRTAGEGGTRKYRSELPLLVIYGPILTGCGVVLVLRKVPTTSREGDVWSEPYTEVMCGELVAVLRQEGEFTWIRTSPVHAGVEGYIRSSYFQSADQQAFVGRADGTTSTMLRKVADTSREPSVFVESRACVRDGEVVSVLRYQPDFCWVKTARGEQGFLKSSYLSAAILCQRDRPNERVQVVRGDGEMVRVWTGAGAQIEVSGREVWPLTWQNTGLAWIMECAERPMVG